MKKEVKTTKKVYQDTDLDLVVKPLSNILSKCVS